MFGKASKLLRRNGNWMPFGSLKPLDVSPDSITGLHVFQCQDRTGIVAKIMECIALKGGNIHCVDVFVPESKPIFYSRSEFTFNPILWPRSVMEEDFMKLSKFFNAERSVVRVPDLDPKYKIAILASKQLDMSGSIDLKSNGSCGQTSPTFVFGIPWFFLDQDHCLVDLLYGWQEGKLPVDIVCIISNHHRAPNTHVIRFLERHGLPYHYLPTTKENKREEEILELVVGTDFLVLARYMQILSGNFLQSYGKDIINIHHGLLPSFKGGSPSKQAYDAGVKLIGATSHFVTEELDAGPIIEQMGDVKKIIRNKNEVQLMSSVLGSYAKPGLLVPVRGPHVHELLNREVGNIRSLIEDKLKLQETRRQNEVDHHKLSKDDNDNATLKETRSEKERHRHLMKYHRQKKVERVSHRDNLQHFVQKSENLEKQCLTKAIRSYCELRVLNYEQTKTVVF